MGTEDYAVIKRIFLEWCKLPKSQRIPPTQSEFAESHGINRKTLSRWMDDPEFKRAIAENTLGYLSADDVTDIMYAMKKKAKEGNVQAAKLLIEMSGLNTARAVEPEPDNLSDLSEEDLMELAGDGDN